MAGLTPAEAAVARHWLATVLVGDVLPEAPGLAMALVAEQARREGVAALVRRRLHGTADHKALYDALAATERQQTAILMAQEMAMARILPALEQAGCTPTLIKGCALAFTHYTDPCLRPRSDMDIIVPETAREAAHQTLSDLGLIRLPAHHGKYINFQTAWHWPGQPGGAVDLHWRINNSLWFAFRAPTADICGRRRLIAGPAGELPVADDVDALLIAALHRLGERARLIPDSGQRMGDRLIWLYDAHLLISGLQDADRDELVARAIHLGLQGAVADLLAQCDAVLGSPVPATWASALAATPSPIPVAAFDQSGWRQVAFEAQALPSLAARCRYLLEHVFPRPAYVRERFGPGWLPKLYVQRALRGLARTLTRR